MQDLSSQISRRTRTYGVQTRNIWFLYCLEIKHAVFFFFSFLNENTNWWNEICKFQVHRVCANQDVGCLDFHANQDSTYSKKDIRWESNTWLWISLKGFFFPFLCSLLFFYSLYQKVRQFSIWNESNRFLFLCKATPARNKKKMLFFIKHLCRKLNAKAFFNMRLCFQ